MSQKDGTFQSKPRRGGQKFGGRDGAPRDFKGEGRRDFRGRGRPEGRGFEGKNEEGDKGSRRPYDRSPRPSRRDGESAAGGNPYKKRSFGDRDEGRRDFKSEGRRDFKSEGRRDFKPEGRRDFGDRPARPPRDRDFGDKPYKKRAFGDKPYQKRESGGEGRRDFKSEGRRDYKPEGRKDFSDRPARPPRERDFGDKKPFNKHSGRPQKSFERYDERPVRKDFSSQLKSDRPSYGAPSSAYLYGVHAVTQALLNPKRLHQRLLCTQKGYESLQEPLAEALEEGIALPQVTYVEKEDIDRLLPRDAVHQDVLLDCQPLEDVFLGDILVNAPENARVLVLDQVTDPHNVGAILRSAAAFGAIAVIMQKLHAPEITGTLAKSASGAVEHVPLVREVNLSRALEQLKEAGFFCIGLAEEGKQPLAKLNLTGKTALVLGAEGAGLRRLVAENCDELAKLPTQGPIGSLNVSNAAAAALYELVRAA